MSYPNFADSIAMPQKNPIKAKAVSVIATVTNVKSVT